MITLGVVYPLRMDLSFRAIVGIIAYVGFGEIRSLLDYKGHAVSVTGLNVLLVYFEF